MAADRSASRSSFISVKAKLPEEIVVETGEESNQVLAALTCGIFIGISIIVGWLLDRYGGGII
jgi:hypothetical protein